MLKDETTQRRAATSTSTTPTPTSNGTIKTLSRKSVLAYFSSPQGKKYLDNLEKETLRKRHEQAQQRNLTTGGSGDASDASDVHDVMLGGEESKEESTWKKVAGKSEHVACDSNLCNLCNQSPTQHQRRPADGLATVAVDSRAPDDVFEANEAIGRDSTTGDVPIRDKLSLRDQANLKESFDQLVQDLGQEAKAGNMGLARLEFGYPVRLFPPKDFPKTAVRQPSSTPVRAGLNLDAEGRVIRPLPPNSRVVLVADARTNTTDHRGLPTDSSVVLIIDQNFGHVNLAPQKPIRPVTSIPQVPPRRPRRRNTLKDTVRLRWQVFHPEYTEKSEFVFDTSSSRTDSKRKLPVATEQRIKRTRDDNIEGPAFNEKTSADAHSRPSVTLQGPDALPDASDPKLSTEPVVVTVEPEPGQSHDCLSQPDAGPVIRAPYSGSRQDQSSEPMVDFSPSVPVPCEEATAEVPAIEVVPPSPVTQPLPRVESPTPSEFTAKEEAKIKVAIKEAMTEPIEDLSAGPAVEPESGMRPSPTNSMILPPQPGSAVEPESGMRPSPTSSMILPPQPGSAVEPESGMRLSPTNSMILPPQPGPPAAGGHGDYKAVPIGFRPGTPAAGNDDSSAASNDDNEPAMSNGSEPRIIGTIPSPELMQPSSPPQSEAGSQNVDVEGDGLRKTAPYMPITPPETPQRHQNGKERAIELDMSIPKSMPPTPSLMPDSPVSLRGKDHDAEDIPPHSFASSPSPSPSGLDTPVSTRRRVIEETIKEEDEEDEATAAGAAEWDESSVEEIVRQTPQLHYGPTRPLSPVSSLIDSPLATKGRELSRAPSFSVIYAPSPPPSIYNVPTASAEESETIMPRPASPSRASMDSSVSVKGKEKEVIHHQPQPHTPRTNRPLPTPVQFTPEYHHAGPSNQTPADANNNWTTADDILSRPDGYHYQYHYTDPPATPTSTVSTISRCWSRASYQTNFSTPPYSRPASAIGTHSPAGNQKLLLWPDSDKEDPFGPLLRRQSSHTKKLLIPSADATPERPALKWSVSMPLMRQRWLLRQPFIISPSTERFLGVNDNDDDLYDVELPGQIQLLSATRGVIVTPPRIVRRRRTRPRSEAGPHRKKVQTLVRYSPDDQLEGIGELFVEFEKLGEVEEEIEAAGRVVELKGDVEEVDVVLEVEKEVEDLKIKRNGLLKRLKGRADRLKEKVKGKVGGKKVKV